ncbi:allophanate hydrolase [Altererythrobacter sp. GH1-8]|uniref:allophanate hydrolase n=1 Tax=Altererythrobacter sp. GH1-8 TaxID=3349333 RepID=UPI00374CEE7D
MSDAGSIARQVLSGEATAESIARDALSRITDYDKVQPQVWISRFPDDKLLELARAIDARVKAGEDLPLAGVPIAVKDNIDVYGLPTTAACPDFYYEPSSNAAVVDQLLHAGALIVGKTNLDQFATGLMGTRSPYGISGCAFNREFISGGSSGGSAIAVAAGLVPIALGTDTAGSGRVPAAINGLFGFKPSPGRWSTSGVVPACRSLDCVSVFALSAQDAALVDSVLAVFDRKDPYSRKRTDAPIGSVVTIGIAQPGQLQFETPEDKALYHKCLAHWADQGVRLMEVDIAFLLEASELLYQGPWVAERTQSVFGQHCVRPDSVHPVVRTILEEGKKVTGADTFAGLHQIQSFRRRAEDLWSKVSAIALPTIPGIVSIADALTRPLERNSMLGRYTNFVNLLDLAGLAIPTGFRANRTGFGVSLIAPASSDRALLDWAASLPPPLADQRPDLDTASTNTVRLAVVGAHLSGMPLHWQLESREAKLVKRCRTVPAYRLFAMADTQPPKPALIRDAAGAAIEVEVYEMTEAAFGWFTSQVPPPLAIGSVEVEGLGYVKGFVAEPRAIEGAVEVTGYGGWRDYIRDCASAPQD